MKHIGETLRSVIEANGLQKNIVAVNAGITPTYLCKIFGKSTLDCALLDRLCKVIGVSPSFFFDDDAQPNITNNHIENLKATSILGGTVNISQGEANTLRALIAEKERTITLLLHAKGFNPNPSPTIQ